MTGHPGNSFLVKLNGPATSPELKISKHFLNPTRPGGGLVGPQLTFVVYIPRTKNVEALRLNDFS